MPKTVSLPPVRVEPELRDELQQISDEIGVSVYALTRQAVAEYVARQRLARPDYRLMVVPDGEPLGAVHS